jgi:hypothetical protein
MKLFMLFGSTISAIDSLYEIKYFGKHNNSHTVGQTFAHKRVRGESRLILIFKK